MKKQLKLFTILLTIVFSIFNFGKTMLFPAVNATFVEGPITQDTIWTLVDSPFILSKDVMVYPNATLTIEPGVEVRFGGVFSLIISGKLYANGTDKTITFTSNREQPEAGDWDSIKFNGTEKSMLIGCFITYAKDGIFIENGRVEIESSEIGFCSQNGINSANGELTVQNTVIRENRGNGVRLTGNRQVIIQRNTIIANENGVLLTGDETSGVDISHNIIAANKQNGIQIDAVNHYNLFILDNTISSNNKGFYISSQTGTSITDNSILYNTMGIFYDQGNHAAHYNDIYDNEMGMDVSSDATVNAEYNYWGDSSGPYHESLNPMGRGNPVGGNGVNLDFMFFLTQPFGYINARPIASLLTDKILVPPNEIVMFFATNSADEGRIDRYLFDFGDNSSSGWTTLSIFTHKYSSLGTYYANLTVMDDFGTTSNNVTVAIDVQNLPPLYVNVELSNSKVNEGEQVSITVYVTNGFTAVEDATVAMFSVKGGEFAQPFGLTNASGYFVTTFTAPDVTQMANVRIVVRASKIGYTDGSDYDYLEVLPFLSVQITANPDVIKSEDASQIIVHVQSNGQPVFNASVTVLSTGGNLSSETGNTDLNGDFSLVFTAPQTITFLNVIITATATKSGHMDGLNQTILIIEPKILTVQITAESTVTISEAKLNVTVYVEYEGIPITGANVTITAENGNFSKTTELTDIYGNATFIFTAPPVNEQSNIYITARATKVRYAENQSQLGITVNPRTFNVQIEASPSTVESGDSATITVHVICQEDATPVAGAMVTVASSDGSFPVMTNTTDSTGICTLVFNAPQTTVQLSIVTTANVTRNGYVDGGNQTTITVIPKTAAEGWPITTILLIIIPIVIVAIVVVLIKTKTIVVSSGEEE